MGPHKTPSFTSLASAALQVKSAQGSSVQVVHVGVLPVATSIFVLTKFIFLSDKVGFPLPSLLTRNLAA